MPTDVPQSTRSAVRRRPDRIIAIKASTRSAPLVSARDPGCGLLLIVVLPVVPAATVRRFSSGPERMAVGAAAAGIVSVAGGLFASVGPGTPSGPSIVVVALAPDVANRYGPWTPAWRRVDNGTPADSTPYRTPWRNRPSMQSGKQRASVRTGKPRNVGGGQPADRNLNDIAYHTIKDDIISCALQPGEDISEGMLAARYRLGKAPIRSAMMRLRQEGLVVSRGRQGNAVSAVTLRDVQEIFQLRLVLEVTAVRLAAGKVDAGRLRSLNEAAHAAWSPGDEARESSYLRANRDLHRYVAESGGNQRLAALVVGLMEQHERIVRLGLALQNREHEFHHFHDDLVDALIEGDGDRAARLTEAALRGGQRKVMEALADSADRISPGRTDLRS